MNLERLKTVRDRVLSLCVKLLIIAGWMFYLSTAYYNNFITVIQIVLWCIVPLLCIGLGGSIAASKYSDKLGSHSKVIAGAQEAFRVQNSWAFPWWIYLIEAPFLLFVGIFMGDWSLLIVQAMVLFLSILFIFSGSELYRRLPLEMKGGDTNNSGISDNEELLKQDGEDPITLLKLRSKEKKEAEIKKREHILDNITDGGL